MRILHITPSYKPAFIYGGPTLSISQLCEHQAAMGEEVSVITTTANGSEELPAGQASIAGVRVRYFKRITGDHTHFCPALLYFLWKYGKSYDVIHIHSWWNMVSVLATLLCWLKGITSILSPRGMLSGFSFTQDNSVKKKIIHTLVGKWLLKSTRLHATSPLEWQNTHSVYPNWKGFVLPNIIDLPEAGFVRPSASHTLKIIFLSRIHPKKGLELTLEALSQCNFPFQLEIYGDGEEEYIQRLKDFAATLGISSSVIWQGWVEGEAKYRALAKSDIFILTSYNENFANVVLESLAVGTPVLVSNQVGMCDYVEQTGAGWVSKLSVRSIIYNLHKAYATRITVDIRQVYEDFAGANISKSYIHEYQQNRHARKVNHHYSNV